MYIEYADQVTPASKRVSHVATVDVAPMAEIWNERIVGKLIGQKRSIYKIEDGSS